MKVFGYYMVYCKYIALYNLWNVQPYLDRRWSLSSISHRCECWTSNPCYFREKRCCGFGARCHIMETRRDAMVVRRWSYDVPVICALVNFLLIMFRLSESQALNPTYIQKKTSYVAMKQVLIVWTYQIKKAAFVRCKGFSFKTPTTGWTKSTVDLWKLKLFLFRSSERTVTKHTAGWWFGIICPID